MRFVRVVAGVVLVAATLMGAPVEAEDGATTTTVAVSTSTVESTTSVAPATTVSSTTTASGESNPCLVEGFACGWAMVESDGSVSGVIVCTVEVCGGGSFAGKRTVLQTRQMEGGNVAGWHGDGVRYDERSNSFTLPGGGSIQSGDRLEDAEFPTTTAVVVTEPLTPEEYFESETEVVVTTEAVAFGVPILDGVQVDYEVRFDPTGPGPERVVERGTVGQDVSSQSVVKRSHARIIVSLSNVGVRRGTLSLQLFAGTTQLAAIDTRIDAVRQYRSCDHMRRDYPNGVRASRAAGTRPAALSAHQRAIVHRGLYLANRGLDRDRDRVVCAPLT